MSLAEDGEKLHEIAEEVLREELSENGDIEIRRNVDYPLYDSENFNKDFPFGTLDFIGINDNSVAAFLTSDNVEYLDTIIDEISSARAYFEQEGFDELYVNGLVGDDTLIEFKQTTEALPPIFNRSTLENEWDSAESQKHFYDSGLLGELHTIPRRGLEANQRVLHRNDYEMLEHNGLIEERDSVYFPTETMDILLASSEDILHVTPREAEVNHPEKLD
jgi:hypothetical protein